MNDDANNVAVMQIAKRIKDECIRTAVESYETASRDGLCCEGAWECAVDSMRNISPSVIISRENALKKGT